MISREILDARVTDLYDCVVNESLGGAEEPEWEDEDHDDRIMVRSRSTKIFLMRKAAREAAKLLREAEQLDPEDPRTAKKLGLLNSRRESELSEILRPEILAKFERVSLQRANYDATLAGDIYVRAIAKANEPKKLRSPEFLERIATASSPIGFMYWHVHTWCRDAYKDVFRERNRIQEDVVEPGVVDGAIPPSDSDLNRRRPPSEVVAAALQNSVDEQAAAEEISRNEEYAYISDIYRNVVITHDYKRAQWDLHRFTEPLAKRPPVGAYRNRLVSQIVSSALSSNASSHGVEEDHIRALRMSDDEDDSEAKTRLSSIRVAIIAQPNKFKTWSDEKTVAPPLSKMKRDFQVWLAEHRLYLWTSDLPNESRAARVAEIVTHGRLKESNGFLAYLKDQDLIKRHTLLLGSNDGEHILGDPDLVGADRLIYVIMTLRGSRKKTSTEFGNPPKDFERWEEERYVRERFKELQEQLETIPGGDVLSANGEEQE